MKRSRTRKPTSGLFVSICALGLALGGFVYLRPPLVERADDFFDRSATRDAQRLTIPIRSSTERSATMHGEVRDERGSAFAGARVCATCANCTLTYSETALCATSDVNGAFSLAVRPDTPYSLSAQSDGFVTAYAREGQILRLEEGAREYFELRLARGSGNLAGTVIDATGGPIAQARVRILSFKRELTPTLEVIADDDGRFTATVPSGNVTIRAEADGYAPELAFHVAPSKNVSIALTPESVVQGVVVDVDSGKPVEAVAVTAFGAGKAPSHPETASDSNGAFAIRGLEPGRYVLRAHGDHHRGGAPRPIEVGLGERISDVRVEVQRALLVLGKIVNADTGEPCRSGVAGLSVRNSSSVPVDEQDDCTNQRVPAITSPIEHDGTVRFQGVVPGHYHVTLRCVDRVYDSGPAVLNVKRSVEPLLWRVRPGNGLLVHVVDSARRPVPHVQLSVELPTKDIQTMMPIAGDDQGNVRTMQNLEPGTYRIHAPDIYGMAPLEVELPRRGGVTELTLELPGSGDLIVNVRGEHGEPLDDVRVVANRLAATGAPAAPAQDLNLLRANYIVATARGDGRHACRALAPAMYRVEVRDGDNPPLIVAEALAVRDGAQLTLDAVVRRGGSIRGRVVDEHGAPVANAWVQARYAGSMDERAMVDLALNMPSTGWSRVLSDDEGNFHLERLSSTGTYDVVAEKDHGSAAQRKNVAAGADITIALASAGAIQGSVMAPDGQPARSFDVTAVSAEVPSAVRRVHVVSHAGRFRLEGVPAGKVQLLANTEEGESAQELLELSPSQTLDGIRLSLRPPPPEVAPTLDESAPKDNGA